jgi:hypothetical protein
VDGVFLLSEGIIFQELDDCYVFISKWSVRSRCINKKLYKFTSTNLEAIRGNFVFKFLHDITLLRREGKIKQAKDIIMKEVQKCQKA